MTWFLFVLIKQVKYYAQDTGHQCSILGRLICLPDCDKTSENEAEICSIWNKCLFKFKRYFTIYVIHDFTTYENNVSFQFLIFINKPTLSTDTPCPEAERLVTTANVTPKTTNSNS
jgi:hypothetical protein